MIVAELKLTIEKEESLTRIEEGFFITMMENLALDAKFLAYGRLDGSTESTVASSTEFKIKVTTNVQGDKL